MELPEIRENEAPSAIAAIYADMRQTTRLPLVNLIYRHLATLPGALPWAWELIRPELLSGALDAALGRVMAGVPVPDSLTDPCIRSVLQPADSEAVAAVVDVYNRGNLLNLVGLGAVRMVLDREPVGQPVGAPLRAGEAEGPEPPRIPSLPKLSELPPETAALVRELAALHDAAGIVPSLYLHLAHWPRFLSSAAGPLRAAVASGELARSRSEAHRLAEIEAEALAGRMVEVLRRPDSAAAIRQALDTFAGHLIPGMAAVGLGLRRALAGGRPPA